MASSFTATRFFTITPGPAPIHGPIAAGGRPLGYCDGFIVDVAGTMTIIGKGGPSDPASAVIINVLGGVRYDFGLKFVLDVTTIGNITGFV